VSLRRDRAYMHIGGNTAFKIDRKNENSEIGTIFWQCNGWSEIWICSLKKGDYSDEVLR